ncbi:MAG: hypothetical protein ACI9U2_000985 [Bradymonadia bacterium]
MEKLARIAGRYRLKARIGKGDMGILWAATDERSALPVAIRVLQRGLDDPRRVARFRASALQAAALDHPHVARVLDEGVDDIGPYIVSEWVNATPLSAWIGASPDIGFLCAVASQICDALSHVHGRGLVHLDLRPKNILVSRGPRGPIVQLVDVGCARIDDGWSDSRVGAPATLKLLGTLRYLAPEVADRPPWQTGPWSDLYSFGLIIWELLTGDIPFGDLQGVALLLRRATTDPPALAANAGQPHQAGLRTLLSRLLARDPLDRPQTAAQVQRTLDAFGEPQAWSDPRSVALIQQPHFGRRHAQAAGFPLWPLDGGPLVGRDAELGTIWNELQQVVAGRGSRMVVVTGAASCGKTRLVDTVALHADVKGAARIWRVHFNAGQDRGGGLAGVIEEMLRAGGTGRDGVAARAAAMSLLLNIDPTDLTTLLPALLHPDAPGFPRPMGFAEPAAHIGGVDAARMTAAVFQEMTRRAADNDALLLWLDDVQHAVIDEVCELVGRILDDPTLPICIVCSARSGAPILDTLRANHPAGDLVRWIELGALSVADERTFLQGRLGVHPMEEQRLLAATHGRADMLDGLSSHLLAGRLVPGPDGNLLMPGTVLPESNAELFSAQLARLPNRGADTLVPDVIAGLALGQIALQPRVIDALIAEGDQPVRRAIAAAERVRLLVSRPNGGWRFASEELRAWLCQGFIERAARWHAIWLRTLERLEGPAHGRFGLERARHAEALDAPDAAIQALLDNASWALGPAEQATRRGLQAAGLARSLALNARDPVRAGRAERLRAQLLRQSGRPHEAIAVLDALEPRLMMPTALSERAWCVLTRGLLALDAGRLDAAQRHFEEADGLFTAAQEPTGRLWIQIGMGHVACRRGHHRLARTLGRDAEQGFKAAGDHRGQLTARVLRADATLAANDHATADERYASLLDLAERRGWLLDTVRFMLIRARLALAMQRPHVALDWLDRAHERARILGLDTLVDFAGAIRPALLAAAGEHAAARAALSKARLPAVALRGEAAEVIELALTGQSTQLDVPLRAQLGRWRSQFTLDD